MKYVVNTDYLSIDAVAAIMYALNIDYGMDCSKRVIEAVKEIAAGEAADVSIELTNSSAKRKFTKCDLCRCFED